MSMIFDTPEDIAFVRACSRKGALALEIKGMKRSSGRQTAYSIVKEVYGFRGNRQSVLEDLTEYIEATLRLRKLPEEDYKWAADETLKIVDWLDKRGEYDQPHFEYQIQMGEKRGDITHEQRQMLSDMFYTAVVSQIAGNR